MIHCLINWLIGCWVISEEWWSLRDHSETYRRNKSWYIFLQADNPTCCRNSWLKLIEIYQSLQSEHLKHFERFWESPKYSNVVWNPIKVFKNIVLNAFPNPEKSRDLVFKNPGIGIWVQSRDPAGAWLWLTNLKLDNAINSCLLRMVTVSFLGFSFFDQEYDGLFLKVNEKQTRELLIIRCNLRQGMKLWLHSVQLRVISKDN